MADVMIRPGATRRLLGDFLNFDPFRAATTGLGFEFTKTESGYAVDLPVPGFAPEQVEVTLEDRVLTISGKAERRSFTRALLIPDEIDAENIGANVQHGLLTLTLNVHPKAQPRKITISTAH